MYQILKSVLSAFLKIHKLNCQTSTGRAGKKEQEEGTSTSERVSKSEIVHTRSTHRHTHMRTHVDPYLCFDQMPQLGNIRKFHTGYVKAWDYYEHNSAVNISKW